MIDDSSVKKNRTELRQERDFEQIQLLAIKLLEKHGFTNFRIDMLIEKIPVSRATFYKYIPSKETLFSLLAVRGLSELVGYVERTQKYEGCTRVQMVAYLAAYLMLSRSQPVLFKTIFMYNMFTADSDVETDLRVRYKEKYDWIVNSIKGTIDKAVENKDLVLPKNITSYVLAFSFWNGICGVTMRELMNDQPDIQGKPLDYYKNYIRTVCDLMKWKPTSDTIDYDPYLQKIMFEIFPKEIKKLS